MSTYIRVLLTIFRENIVIRPCDGHQPTELFISLISDLVPITLFSRKYYNSVTSLQEEHSHPGRTFSITYQVHVVQTLAGAEHKYKLCNFVLGFVFIAPPYVNLFRGKLGNPFREKTDNPFREKTDNPFRKITDNPFRGKKGTKLKIILWSKMTTLLWRKLNPFREKTDNIFREKTDNTVLWRKLTTLTGENWKTFSGENWQPFYGESWQPFLWRKLTTLFGRKMATLFRRKLTNPFREKTDNPFREKFDENEPRLRQKRPHEAAWVGNSSTVYDGGSRTHTRLGQFPKLDCSTNKRVPTPNDASSESSRRHVSNACLVGTDTIPTMGISSMEKSAQGIPGVIDNVVYGYCSH